MQTCRTPPCGGGKRTTALLGRGAFAPHKRFAPGENLGKGAALPTPSIEIPKGGGRLGRPKPKKKGLPIGSPFFLECKTNKDVCENPLFARLCGSAPLIFSFFRLGLGGFSAEGGF